MSNQSYAADISSIKEANERIKPFIHTTLVLSSESLNEIAKKKLLFKCECFQKGGAFKFRGALNAVLSIDEQQASKGVVTHSTGNHAATMSLAAHMRGIPAYVVVPNNAPKCKIENIKRYGGRVVCSEPSMKDRETALARLVSETGGIYIPSSNDPRVISGQGTIALELLEEFPEIDMIIAPVGGGGLISGIAIAAKSLKSSIQIVAAEPIGANDATLSKAAGKIITLPQPYSVADGLKASLGDLTWPVVRDLVDDIVLVDDDEIIEAMKYCYDILKIVVEPSGAIGLAAVLSESFQNNRRWTDCNNIAIVISGGNTDLGALWNRFRNV